MTVTDPALADQLDLLREQMDRLRQSRQNADARRADAEGLRRQVTSLEVTTQSADRAVTVVAGPGGSVKNITFSEQARALSPTQLSQATMSTLRLAVAEAARRQAEVVQEFLGGGSDVLERVLRTQEEMFGRFGSGDQPAGAEPADAGLSVDAAPRTEPASGPEPNRAFGASHRRPSSDDEDTPPDSFTGRDDW